MYSCSEFIIMVCSKCFQQHTHNWCYTTFFSICATCIQHYSKKNCIIVSNAWQYLFSAQFHSKPFLLRLSLMLMWSGPRNNKVKGTHRYCVKIEVNRLVRLSIEVFWDAQCFWVCDCQQFVGT